MAAENAAKPPHPSTPAFRPAAKQKKNKCEKEKYADFNLKHQSKYTRLHTTKSNGSSGHTAAVHCVLPVRLASVLQMKKEGQCYALEVEESMRVSIAYSYI